MRSAFSMMSARLSAGPCLEGNPAVPFDAGPQARFLGWLRQQFHTPANDLREAPFQCDQTEKVHACVRIKLGGKVHVAVSLFVAASDGTEQRQPADAGAAQFCFVRA